MGSALRFGKKQKQHFVVFLTGAKDGRSDVEVMSFFQGKKKIKY